MQGGDYVLMARRRAGLTQRELAGRLGLRQATIARWERGDRQVSMEDVEAVAAACGLHLDAHLVIEDRSWWPQIALQLELDPLERVQRLSPPGSPDVVASLRALAASRRDAVVIGEVAGALQGWPLVLSGEVIEVCAPATAGASLRAAAREASGAVRVRVVESPPGTQGFGDLWRGSEPFDLPEGPLRVASVVDLLRIADASTRGSARLEALAYQSVLDVQRAHRSAPSTPGSTPTEKIEAWLRQQTPVAT
jgi:transcriptional regulator with XRE-family HTH domain